MDFFQNGIYYQEVSSAQVDNIVKFFDDGIQAVRSAAAIDWKRSDITRMKVRLGRLRDELKYVLREQNIPIDSITAFQNMFNDDVVPVDNVAEISNETNYPKVRSQNFAIPTVNELNSLVTKNSGPTMNRIMNLLMEITFTRVSIDRIESDLSSISSARKQFSDKKDSDPETYERLCGMLSMLSEMSGYANALFSLVENYPKATPTDVTIRAVSSQFDQSCRMWRRYKRKLGNTIKDYQEKYADFITKAVPTKIRGDFLSRAGDDYELTISRMLSAFNLRYNKVTKEYTTTLRTHGDLIKKIDEYIIMGPLPEQYTGVPSMISYCRTALMALVEALGVSKQFVEESLIEWSGGKALASSNPAIAKVIEKANQLVASPVIRAKVDPLTRDAFLEKSLIDFRRVSNTVKKVRDFLEMSTDKIKDAITRKLVDFDPEFLRKIAIRKVLPIPGSLGTMKPVEDAVRERVRKRYGDNVPFEDEVNVGKDEAPEWVKESLAIQESSTGKWVKKTEQIAAELKSQVKEGDVSTR